MRWARIITHAIVATLAMPVLFAATGDSSQPFTISISAAKTIIRVGDDIVIQVALTNVSDHGIRIPPVTLDAACDYIIQVQGEKGLISSKPNCSGSHIMGIRQLKPGESVEGKITLSEIFHYDSKVDDMVKTFYFTSPGEYVVQLSRHISDDPDKEIVKSNKITITVVTAYTPEPEAGAPK
jgi:hypothetical protein